MKLIKREMPMSQSPSGQTLFLKFKDGESKVGVFRGEIYEFYQYWENGKSQIVSADHPQAKTRFRLNFVTKEDGELKVKIFEFGLTVYNQLAEINSEYDLEKTAVKISRRGVGTDTIWIIMPAKDQPKDQALKAIEALPLNMLEHKEPAQKVIKNHAPGAEDDELPF